MAGLLDTDVATLLPLLRRGLDWWLGELADLARPLLRERGASGLGTVATRRSDGRYALERRGEPIGLADPHHPVAATLIMPAELVLVRRSPVAGLSRRDALRLLENDIDRLTPFSSDQVYSAVRFAPSATAGQVVDLAVTPRARAEAVVRAAMAGGVRPAALLAPTRDGEGLDLLPALRVGGAFGRARRPWRAWLVVAVLLVLNLGAAVWRDVRDTDRLAAEVNRRQPVAARVNALRRQVLAERLRRQTLLAERTRSAPLPVLATATRALPDGAWAERLSYEDGQLRLAGFHRPGLDVLAALQAAPGFTAMRNASADVGAAGAGASLGEAFDILASVGRPAPKAQR